ncbi:restriction endonuclease subunit S [Empedobacter sp.]|uniref:restriction endonuclease subunit S n=1 Tax=Empedobacter sp. TaxID=1927715 RepID=UPI00289AC41E|nr:restriction endonuclease subunit S [Empedobacter sp.]
MRKYEEYKHSGIDWLGEFPSNWNIKRLKDVLSEPLKYGANEPAIEEDINEPRYIRITDFNDDEKLKEDTFKSLKLSIAKPYLLKNGDILFARSGATVGKSFHFNNYDGLACYAGYLIKASPNKNIIISSYLSYFTKSIRYDEWKKSIFIQSTIQNISAEKYNSLSVVFPTPLQEQQAIANYLDAKTQAIDKKVTLLEQKIETYKKLKRTLINQTITKGLRSLSEVEMKDSGISWIGQIPKHWEVKRLKDLGTAIIGLTYSPENLVSENEGILVLRSSNIQNNKLSLLDNVYVDIKPNEKLITKKGDILLCSRNGSRALIGKNIIIDDLSSNLTFGAFMTLYRSKYNKFISYFFNSKLFDFQSGVFMTSTINQLTINVLNNLILPFPPKSEQEEIAKYLDHKTATIDAIVSNIGKQIETLKQLRKTLINDVVTGKIKVIE